MTDYIIGKYYDVPAVFVDRWIGWKKGWIPIIGPMHSDAEIIGFPHEHFHVDWRFVPQRIVDSVKKLTLFQRTEWANLYAIPIQKKEDKPWNRIIIVEGPTLKRFSYKRHFGPWPIAKWHSALEEKFAGILMKNMICPHRGISVKDCKIINGIVECPGHGLRWNIETGTLVPRNC